MSIYGEEGGRILSEALAAVALRDAPWHIYSPHASPWHRDGCHGGLIFRPRHQKSPRARVICVGHRHEIECFGLVQSPTELATAVEGGRNRCLKLWIWARSRRMEGVHKKCLYTPLTSYCQTCSILPLRPAPIPHLGSRIFLKTEYSQLCSRRRAQFVTDPPSNLWEDWRKQG